MNIVESLSKLNFFSNELIGVDNLSFHGLVGSEENLSRSLRQLVTKIQRYIDWIKNNEEWDTTITDKGDGMSISRRK